MYLDVQCIPWALGFDPFHSPGEAAEFLYDKTNSPPDARAGVDHVTADKAKQAGIVFRPVTAKCITAWQLQVNPTLCVTLSAATGVSDQGIAVSPYADCVYTRFVADTCGLSLIEIEVLLSMAVARAPLAYYSVNGRAVVQRWDKAKHQPLVDKWLSTLNDWSTEYAVGNDASSEFAISVRLALPTWRHTLIKRALQNLLRKHGFKPSRANHQPLADAPLSKSKANAISAELSALLNVAVPDELLTDSPTVDKLMDFVWRRV